MSFQELSTPSYLFNGDTFEPGRWAERLLILQLVGPSARVSQPGNSTHHMVKKLYLCILKTSSSGVTGFSNSSLRWLPFTFTWDSHQIWAVHELRSEFLQPGSEHAGNLGCMELGLDTLQYWGIHDIDWLCIWWQRSTDSLVERGGG